MGQVIKDWDEKMKSNATFRPLLLQQKNGDPDVDNDEDNTFKF